jgi:hypothetical protein
VTRRITVLAALVALAVPAASTATTEPVALVNVRVGLTAHRVSFDVKQVPRGNYAQFHLRNTTGVRRRFTLAGRSVVIPARRVRLLVLFFDVRGRYPYVSRGGGTAIRGVFRVS